MTFEGIDLSKTRVLFVVNEPYFFFSHRMILAEKLLSLGAVVHIAAPNNSVWAPEGFDLKDLERRGLICHPISMSRRGQNPFAEMKTLLALVRLLRAVKPDLVHLLTIKPIIYGGIAARITGVPAVVAFTGLGHTFVTHGVLAILRRAAVAFVLKIAVRSQRHFAIFQNQEDQTRMESLLGLRKDRTFLIRGAGVDTTHFVPLPESEAAIHVVLPSRLIREKGIEDFVEGARRLRSSGVKNVRFVLVGDTHASNPQAIPVDWIGAWVREGVIEWWGRREDMLEVYRQAHIVCLPSYYGEGLPKVLLEAAACGRPCVTSDIPGCSDAVVNEVNGLLVPPRSPTALAEALHRLIESPSLRHDMGVAARRRVVDQFDVEHVANQTFAVYRLLLGKSEG